MVTQATPAVQPTAEERALIRALNEGTQVKHLHGELWLASSTSRPGTWHVVNGRCDCEAGRHGIPCKHVAAVKHARLVAHTCHHCGIVSVDVEPAVEHIGGIGAVVMFQCADLVACWQRWDEQNGFQPCTA